MKKKIYYSPYKFDAYGEEEIQAVVKCLKDGWLGGNGPLTEEFEKKIAQKFGKEFGIFVNSGSSANLLALAGLKLPKGTKILTPACTFSTTVAPIIQLGLVPVFCDVELNTFVPSVKMIYDILKEDIKEEIKVILLPNLIGNKPDWKQLKYVLQLLDREDICLIEDSCDTITTTLESDISTTSFYASHIITAGGTGGMVMVNTESMKNSILQYRDWGRRGNDGEDLKARFKNNDILDANFNFIPYDHKFLYDVLGYNFKSSEMNAAFGLIQFKKLNQFIEIRRRNFKRYLENLKSQSELILPNDELESNWLAIPLTLDSSISPKRRKDLLEHLENNQIQTRVCFSGNITNHPAYSGYKQCFKNSDKIMANSFLLGCHQGMTVDDVDYVCDCIKSFFDNESK